MKCIKCNEESSIDVTYISPIWFCESCITKDVFDDIHDTYKNENNIRILYVSSKENRLDQMAEFVLSGIDLLNLTNTITLVSAEGIEHLHKVYDFIYIDNDLICKDWHYLIPQSTKCVTKWVDCRSWQLL